MIVRKRFVNEITSLVFCDTAFDLVDLICGAQPKGVASARLLVNILGVDEGGVNTVHLPQGMGKPPKELVEITFLSVIELCREDGAAAAPMNHKTTVFFVDKGE